jgi:amidophosphoribosyltransferase
MNEECGICGFSGNKAERKTFRMLVQLQHRGQLSAGITSFSNKKNYLLKTHKGLGLANVAFKAYDKNKFSTIMENLSSKKAIGHVRYATSGEDDVEYAQPFERKHGRKQKWFSFCFNGNIVNYKQLKKELESKDYHITRETDTEILEHLISKELKKTPNNLKQVVKNVSKKIDGAYNIAFMNGEGTIIVVRDPLGLKPLCYSEKDYEIAFASESVALTSIGFTKIKDVPPGHILTITNKAVVEPYTDYKRKHCFFEWVYFAHPASTIEKKLVYNARFNFGVELGKTEKLKVNDKDWVVVSVPDSSNPAGSGFAGILKLPHKEGLIRNRYVGRTFIESKSRSERVKEKFSIAREVFEGKNVFLLDDSIVRGTTMKGIIDFIKTNGNPKSIHVRVSCPPIMWPCFYGIDMGSKSELLIKKNTKEEIEKIRKELGVDSIIYQKIDDMINAIGLPSNDLCKACIDGDYPTKLGQQLGSFCGKGRACE